MRLLLFAAFVAVQAGLAFGIYKIVETGKGDAWASCLGGTTNRPENATVARSIVVSKEGAHLVTAIYVDLPPQQYQVFRLDDNDAARAAASAIDAQIAPNAALPYRNGLVVRPPQPTEADADAFRTCADRFPLIP